MSGPFCFIVNPHAGGGLSGRLATAIREQLRKAGVEHRWQITESPLAALRAVERLDDGWTPVAVGGDGTVLAIADAVAPSRPVGHLPTGTCNDFARSVGISRHPAKALAQLIHGRARPIDLPAANGRTFLGVAGASFGRLFRLVRDMGGPGRDGDIAIGVDGVTERGRAHMVAVGNGRFFGGGLNVCPHAHPDDGLLDLMVADRSGALQSLLTLMRLRRGAHLGGRDVHYLKAHVIDIDGPCGTPVVADGQVLTKLPVTISLRQHALHVIVPRESWNPSKVRSILKGRPGPLDSGAQG